MKALAGALALSLMVSCSAFAAEAPQYARSQMALAGPLLGLATDDMDGDGLSDLVAVSLKGADTPRPRRVVEVFYQKKAGGFPERPDLSWDMHAAAAAFDTADVAGKGGKSVCFIAPDGVYAYLPGTNGRSYSARPARIISTDSVFTGCDPMDMPRYPLFARLGGVTAALVPGMSSLSVYERGPSGFERRSSAGMPVKTEFSGGRGPGADGTTTISHKVPSVFVTGFDTGAASDIVMAWDDNALVFLRGPDGRYKGSPDVSFKPGLMEGRRRGPMEGAWLTPADLDGDGRLDFAVTKKTGGMAHTRSLIFIYMRGKSAGFPAKPGHTIITEGVIGPRFVDVDGDGRLDILIPSIKVGISNFVNMLTSSRVNVDIDIYMQGKGGSFPDRPTKTKSVGFKLDLSNLAKAAPVLETGRFTKSGGYGLAAVSGDESISVYLPDRYSLLSDRPGLELDVEAPTEMELSDLNGDGIDDFVLTYKKSEALSGRLCVFLSK